MVQDTLSRPGAPKCRRGGEPFPLPTRCPRPRAFRLTWVKCKQGPGCARPAPLRHRARLRTGLGAPEAERSPAFTCLRAKSSGTHEVPDSFVITMQKKKNSFKYRRKQNTRPKAGSASHPSPSLTRTQRRKKTLSKAPSGFRNQSRKEKKNTATGAFQSDQLCTCSETHT